jgi:hypothetical protein
VLNQPNCSYVMRSILHKLMVYNTEKVKHLHNSLDRESIEFLHTCFMNYGVCQISPVTGWQLWQLTGSQKSITRDCIAQDWDSLLRRWRDVVWALLVLPYPSSSGQTERDLITRMSGNGNEKKEQNS